MKKVIKQYSDIPLIHVSIILKAGKYYLITKIYLLLDLLNKLFQFKYFSVYTKKKLILKDIILWII